jgi:uncharacterized membrane protein
MCYNFIYFATTTVLYSLLERWERKIGWNMVHFFLIFLVLKQFVIVTAHCTQWQNCMNDKIVLLNCIDTRNFALRILPDAFKDRVL